MTARTLRIATMIVVVLAFASFPNPRAVQAVGTGISMAPEAAVRASTAANPPDGFLNPDGTLRLDGTVAGTLDLNGWTVRIDDTRGPVFTVPQGEAEMGPTSVPSPGNWGDLGSGSGALNGTVYAMAVSGTSVYVGGKFTNAGGDPEADCIARWDGKEWSAVGGTGQGYGAISASVTSGVFALAVSSTALYVGGSFSGVYNGSTWIEEADRIAKWDGTNWSALGSNGAGDGSLNSVVYAVAVNGANVYAGGAFTDVNNGGLPLTAADYVARWDGSNWTALGNNGASNGALNDVVRALAISGSNVFAGGTFTNAANILAADYIAKWDGSNWSALGSSGGMEPNGSLNGSVRALAVSGELLYVGGEFTNVNNGGTVLPAADYVAMWSGTEWSALGSGFSGDGSIGDYVLALAADETGLYVGGSFVNVFNSGTVLPAADYVAKWNGANWSALGHDSGGEGALPPEVYAVGVVKSRFFAGGAFDYVTNSEGRYLANAGYAAQFDGTEWSPIGKIDGAINKLVYVIAVAGADVYVGGSFLNAGGLQAADYIAKWNGTTGWSALGDRSSGEGSLNGTVRAIAVNGSNVYAAGHFYDVYDHATLIPEADYVARWDGSHWHALGSNGLGNGALNGWAMALVASGSNLYAGGLFTDAAGIAQADHVARWNGTSWSALGDNGAGGGALNSAVAALAANGSDLYVGGYFTDAANHPAADYVAKWNGSSWSALGNNGAAGDGALSSTVYTLAVSGSNVYAGGIFTDVSNGGATILEADYIAKWDGANWSALGGGSGNGSLNADVYAVAVSGGNVYAAGYFTDVNDHGTTLGAADYVARWDGSHWSALGSDGLGDGSLGDAAIALALSPRAVYVGGNFINVNNNGAVLPYGDHIAAYGIAPKSGPPSDFDGDRKSEPAKFYPSTGVLWWFEPNSGPWSGVGLGSDATSYVPRSDFDGDVKADPAKFVSAAGAIWYLKSSTGGWDGIYVGSDYSPSAAGSDFDGDGKTDPAKYVVASGAVWYLPSSTGTWNGVYIGSDAAPYLSGSDYDGDGKTDMAKYVPAAGAIWYLKSSTGAWDGIYIGSDGIPVPGSDFDGDGRTDPAKFVTSSNALWYLASGTGIWHGLYLGPGSYNYVSNCDFDGDWKTDPATFVPSSGSLWYTESSTGTYRGVWMGGDTFNIAN